MKKTIRNHNCTPKRLFVCANKGKAQPSIERGNCITFSVGEAEVNEKGQKKICPKTKKRQVLLLDVKGIWINTKFFCPFTSAEFYATPNHKRKMINIILKNPYNNYATALFSKKE